MKVILYEVLPDYSVFIQTDNGLKIDINFDLVKDWFNAKGHNLREDIKLRHEVINEFTIVNFDDFMDEDFNDDYANELLKFVNK